jgi:ferric-dicitrate binding protein FerR (iron transport regulator)
MIMDSGTGFNVNARSPKKIIVTVVRGLVQVSDDKHALAKIGADEQVEVDL